MQRNLFELHQSGTNVSLTNSEDLIFSLILPSFGFKNKELGNVYRFHW